MDLSRRTLRTEPGVSVNVDPFWAAATPTLRGRWLRYAVGLFFIAYGISVFVLDIKLRSYGIKAALMLSTAVLLLSPRSYPFLFGLILSVPYDIKTHEYASSYTDYVFGFTPVMIILMAVFQWLWIAMDRRRRNPYATLDICSFCLVGLLAMATLGWIVIENQYSYAERMATLLAFVLAFHMGRSSVNIEQTLRLLLSGLALGIFALEFPYSIGYVLREGPAVLGKLDRHRLDMGTLAVSTVSGTLLTMFALGLSASCSSLSRNTKRIALWAVAAPAGAIVLLYLSRAATVLLLATVCLVLLFAGRRRTATLVAGVILLLGAVAYVRFPDLFLTFGRRMDDLSGAASFRADIRTQAIEVGLSHPLVGIGAGQYNLKNLLASHAHNEEFNILAEHGVVAFVLYLTFWGYLGLMALRLRMSREPDMRSLAAVFLTVFPVYLAFSQTAVLYFNSGGMLVAFCAGLLAPLYRRANDTNLFAPQFTV